MLIKDTKDCDVDEIATERVNRVWRNTIEKSERCCPAAAAGREDGGKKRENMGNTDYSSHTQTPQASYGDKTPVQNGSRSAGSSTSPCLSHISHTHSCSPPAHRHQSVGFNWVLSVYHWVDGSKQLQTQTIPGTPLRSAWFPDNHTWGPLVISNLNSKGVLVLLTGTTVEYLFYKTLWGVLVFLHTVPAAPESHCSLSLIIASQWKVSKATSVLVGVLLFLLLLTLNLYFTVVVTS